MTATDRKFMFATLVVSVGWLLQWLEYPSAGYWVTFGVLLTFRRSEYTREFRAHKMWVMLGTSILIVGLLVGYNYLLPSSAKENVESVRHHGSYVAALWLLTLFCLYRLWKMESKKLNKSSQGQQ
jgi:hypothetical protein